MYEAKSPPSFNKLPLPLQSIISCVKGADGYEIQPLNPNLIQELESYLTSTEHCYEILILNKRLLEKYGKEPGKVFKCLQIIYFCLEEAKPDICSIMRLFLPDLQYLLLTEFDNGDSDLSKSIIKSIKAISEHVTNGTSLPKMENLHPGDEKEPLPKPVTRQSLSKPNLDFRQSLPKLNQKPKSQKDSGTGDEDLFDPFMKDKNSNLDLMDPIESMRRANSLTTSSSSKYRKDLADLTNLFEPISDSDMFEPIFTQYVEAPKVPDPMEVVEQFFSEDKENSKISHFESIPLPHLKFPTDFHGDYPSDIQIELSPSRPIDLTSSLKRGQFGRFQITRKPFVKKTHSTERIVFEDSDMAASEEDAVPFVEEEVVISSHSSTE